MSEVYYEALTTHFPHTNNFQIRRNLVVSAFIGPAVMKIIDPDQFGALPKSSTALALTSMLHHWTRATDGTGSAVRVVLFDYRKAFDYIDHQLLTHKIYSLDIFGE